VQPRPITDKMIGLDAARRGLAHPLTRARLARLWSYLRPSRGRIALVIVLAAATAASGLAAPLYLKVLLDGVFGARLDRGLLIRATAAMAAVSVTGFVLGLAQQLQLARVSTRVLLRMRQDFYEHVHELPMRFFSKARTGEILTRLTRDLSDVHGAVIGSALGLVSSAVTILGSAALLWRLSSQLFWLSIAVCLALAGLTRLFRGMVMRRTRAVREANETLAAFLVESVSATKEVRLFDRRRGMARRFCRLQVELSRRVLRSIAGAAFAGGLPSQVAALASLAIFLRGGFLVLEGRETIGDLMAFAALQTRVWAPMRGLMGLYVELQRAAVGLDRVFEYLDTPGEREDPRAPAPKLRAGPGALRFEGVTFAYDGGSPALSDVSFDIAAHGTLAVAGRNGAGKSTLTELLFRLHRPNAGRILIDGEDIATVERSSLAGALAVVSQDPVLFRGTLRDNVLWGAPRAPAARLAQALEATGLDLLAARLPEGFGTVIGERGAHVSAGERQRISIARALLKDPRILVLDEAESHLDWEGDEQLRRALAQLGRGCTRIVVSHRPKELAAADRILILERGAVAAIGTHAELAAGCAIYRAILAEGAGFAPAADALSAAGHAQTARRAI
jgi:ATP-binding cassette, subfamily B, bacterial